MPFNDSGEPCGRCLIHLNVSGVVRAKWTDEEAFHVDVAKWPTDPKYMYEWCKEMMLHNNVIFEWDSWAHAVIPITTLNGDLICVAHLMAETERQYNERIGVIRSARR